MPYAISSSLFDSQLHRNRLQRIVVVAAGDGDDLVCNLHAPKDLAEDGLSSVQPAVIRDADIELRAVVVEVLRALLSRILAIETALRHVVESYSHQPSVHF